MKRKSQPDEDPAKATTNELANGPKSTEALPATPEAASDDIEELPVKISNKLHVTLKTLVAVCLSLVTVTYALTRFLQVDPVERKLKATEETLTSLDAEKTALLSK